MPDAFFLAPSPRSRHTQTCVCCYGLLHVSYVGGAENAASESDRFRGNDCKREDECRRRQCARCLGCGYGGTEGCRTPVSGGERREGARVGSHAISLEICRARARDDIAPRHFAHEYRAAHKRHYIPYSARHVTGSFATGTYICDI